MRRQYKTGSKWAFWRWTDDIPHLTRLFLIKTPFFSICLHWLLGPDPEPWLHDHPVNFLSLVLWGGYEEDRSHPSSPWVFVHNVSWWNWFTASAYDKHRIISVKPHTLTLCFMGPRRRDWGFHTNNGWVCWKDYYK